jgi:hypothetical protein
MLNMILKMKFNFNMAIGYDLGWMGSTFKVTDPCDLHHAVAWSIKRCGQWDVTTRPSSNFPSRLENGTLIYLLDRHI